MVDRCQIGAFASHKYGISCVAFSPNAKYVISVGFQHDNVINVWDWKVIIFIRVYCLILRLEFQILIVSCKYADCNSICVKESLLYCGLF